MSTTMAAQDRTIDMMLTTLQDEPSIEFTVSSSRSNSNSLSQTSATIGSNSHSNSGSGNSAAQPPANTTTPLATARQRRQSISAHAFKMMTIPDDDHSDGDSDAHRGGLMRSPPPNSGSAAVIMDVNDEDDAMLPGQQQYQQQTAPPVAGGGSSGNGDGDNLFSGPTPEILPTVHYDDDDDDNDMTSVASHVSSAAPSLNALSNMDDMEMEGIHLLKQIFPDEPTEKLRQLHKSRLNQGKSGQSAWDGTTASGNMHGGMVMSAPYPQQMQQQHQHNQQQLQYQLDQEQMDREERERQRLQLLEQQIKLRNQMEKRKRKQRYEQQMQQQQQMPLPDMMQQQQQQQQQFHHPHQQFQQQHMPPPPPAMPQSSPYSSRSISSNSQFSGSQSNFMPPNLTPPNNNNNSSSNLQMDQHDIDMKERHRRQFEQLKRQQEIEMQERFRRQMEQLQRQQEYELQQYMQQQQEEMQMVQMNSQPDQQRRQSISPVPRHVEDERRLEDQSNSGSDQSYTLQQHRRQSFQRQTSENRNMGLQQDDNNNNMFGSSRQLGRSNSRSDDNMFGVGPSSMHQSQLGRSNSKSDLIEDDNMFGAGPSMPQPQLGRSTSKTNGNMFGAPSSMHQSQSQLGRSNSKSDLVEDDNMFGAGPSLQREQSQTLPQSRAPPSSAAQHSDLVQDGNMFGAATAAAPPPSLQQHQSQSGVNLTSSQNTPSGHPGGDDNERNMFSTGPASTPTLTLNRNQSQPMSAFQHGYQNASPALNRNRSCPIDQTMIPRGNDIVDDDDDEDEEYDDAQILNAARMFAGEPPLPTPAPAPTLGSSGPSSRRNRSRPRRQPMGSTRNLMQDGSDSQSRNISGMMIDPHARPKISALTASTMSSGPFSGHFGSNHQNRNRHDDEDDDDDEIDDEQILNAARLFSGEPIPAPAPPPAPAPAPAAPYSVSTSGSSSRRRNRPRRQPMASRRNLLQDSASSNNSSGLHSNISGLLTSPTPQRNPVRSTTNRGAANDDDDDDEIDHAQILNAARMFGGHPQLPSFTRNQSRRTFKHDLINGDDDQTEIDVAQIENAARMFGGHMPAMPVIQRNQSRPMMGGSTTPASGGLLDDDDDDDATEIDVAQIENAARMFGGGGGIGMGAMGGLAPTLGRAQSRPMDNMLNNAKVIPSRHDVLSGGNSKNDDDDNDNNNNDDGNDDAKENNANDRNDNAANDDDDDNNNNENNQQSAATRESNDNSNENETANKEKEKEEEEEAPMDRAHMINAARLLAGEAPLPVATPVNLERKTSKPIDAKVSKAPPKKDLSEEEHLKMLNAARIRAGEPPLQVATPIFPRDQARSAEGRASREDGAAGGGKKKKKDWKKTNKTSSGSLESNNSNKDDERKPASQGQSAASPAAAAAVPPQDLQPTTSEMVQILNLERDHTRPRISYPSKFDLLDADGAVDNAQNENAAAQLFADGNGDAQAPQDSSNRRQMLNSSSGGLLDDNVDSAQQNHATMNNSSSGFDIRTAMQAISGAAAAGAPTLDRNQSQRVPQQLPESAMEKSKHDLLDDDFGEEEQEHARVANTKPPMDIRQAMEAFGNSGGPPAPAVMQRNESQKLPTSGGASNHSRSRSNDGPSSNGADFGLGRNAANSSSNNNITDLSSPPASSGLLAMEQEVLATRRTNIRSPAASGQPMNVVECQRDTGTPSPIGDMENPDSFPASQMNAAQSTSSQNLSTTHGPSIYSSASNASRNQQSPQDEPLLDDWGEPIVQPESQPQSQPQPSVRSLPSLTPPPQSQPRPMGMAMPQSQPQPPPQPQIQRQPSFEIPQQLREMQMNVHQHKGISSTQHSSNTASAAAPAASLTEAEIEHETDFDFSGGPQPTSTLGIFLYNELRKVHRRRRQKPVQWKHENVPEDFLRLPMSVAFQRYHSYTDSMRWELVQDLEDQALEQHKNVSVHYKVEPCDQEDFYTVVLIRDGKVGLGMTLSEYANRILVHSIAQESPGSRIGPAHLAGVEADDYVVGINGIAFDASIIPYADSTVLRHAVQAIQNSPDPLVVHLQRRRNNPPSQPPAPAPTPTPTPAATPASQSPWNSNNPVQPEADQPSQLPDMQQFRSQHANAHSPTRDPRRFSRMSNVTLETLPSSLPPIVNVQNGRRHESLLDTTNENDSVASDTSSITNLTFEAMGHQSSQKFRQGGVVGIDAPDKPEGHKVQLNIGPPSQGLQPSSSQFGFNSNGNTDQAGPGPMARRQSNTRPVGILRRSSYGRPKVAANFNLGLSDFDAFDETNMDDIMNPATSNNNSNSNNNNQNSSSNNNGSGLGNNGGSNGNGSTPTTNPSHPPIKRKRIHPFAKALAKRELLGNTQEEWTITQTLNDLTERTRQWEANSTLRIHQTNHYILPQFNAEDLPNELSALCFPFEMPAEATASRSFGPSTPTLPMDSPMIPKEYLHMLYGEDYKPDNGGDGDDDDGGQDKRLGSFNSSNSGPSKKGLFTYPGQTESQDGDGTNPWMTSAGPTPEFFIPLMGIRKSLCTRIVNTVVEGERLAYTIWCYDVESGKEWYSPIRYIEDFFDLREATVPLCPSGSKITQLPFPKKNGGGGLFGGKKEIEESESVRQDKIHQLEHFLRALCSLMYTQTLHPDIGEIAVHVQSFLGCEMAFAEGSGVPGEGVNQLHVDQKGMALLELENPDHSTVQLQVRLMLKRGIQRYTCRLFLVESMSRIVDHFVDNMRARGPLLGDVEALEGEAKAALKSRALEEMDRMQAYLDHLQELIMEGCMDDFESISSRREYHAIKDWIEATSGGERVYWNRLVREAVREQIEIEVYVPLRSVVSRLLINGWKHEDMEVHFKMQQLRQRSQQDFRIPNDKMSPSNWQSVAEILHQGVARSTLPCAKLRAIVDAAREITRLQKDESNVDSPLSADDFLPIFIYTVVRAAMERPCALCVLLRTLCDSMNRIGEIGYFLASFEAAVTHIQEINLSETGSGSGNDG